MFYLVSDYRNSLYVFAGELTTIQYKEAASQNSVCITQQMCHIMILFQDFKIEGESIFF